MKGLFIPEITAEMFRNGCLESIEALMAEGEIYDVDIPVAKNKKIVKKDGLVEIKNLTPGTVVEVGGFQMEILDAHYPTSEGGEGVFCIAKDIAFCKAFDDGNLNNWAASSLREYLNEKFKGELIEKIGEDALLTFERDLTSDDGLKGYENCIDEISLISCGEYRKYHQYISDKDIWWWTLTSDSVPIFTHSPSQSKYAAYGRSRYVRIVRSDGSLTNSDAYCGYFGVAPVLCLLSSLNVIKA